MRKIYKQAESIVTWLGPRSSNTPIAFSIFQDLYQHRLDKKYVANTLRDAQKVESLKAVIDLFDRSYWDRVWVLQEVNYARNITIMCRRYKIDWSKVGAVQDMLWSDHDKYIIRLSSDEPRLSNLAHFIQHRGVESLELPRLDSSNLPDLYTTLSTFWTKRSTDPRNKIYGLVGLTTAQDDPRFIIDYSASVRRVYIDVVKYILVSSYKLDVIWSMPRGVNEFDLPSWVPDWTVSSKKVGSTLNPILTHEGIPFSSAGRSIAEAEFKLGDQSLMVNGILLSRIQFIGQKSTSENRYELSSGIPVLLSWYRLSNVIKATTSVQVNAFCRAVFYDRFSAKDFGKRSPSQLMEEILAAIALLAEEICPEEIVDPHLVALKKSVAVSKWWAKSWISSACSITRHRRFFVSDSDLIGICPGSTEPGDIICILLGCSLPVVLRPRDGHFVFLGEAYVHDYMYVRAMQELAEGKFQLKPFEIR